MTPLTYILLTLGAWGFASTLILLLLAVKLVWEDFHRRAQVYRLEDYRTKGSLTRH